MCRAQVGQGQPDRRATGLIDEGCSGVDLDPVEPRDDAGAVPQNEHGGTESRFWEVEAQFFAELSCGAAGGGLMGFAGAAEVGEGAGRCAGVGGALFEQKAAGGVLDDDATVFGPGIWVQRGHGVKRVGPS